MNTRRYLLLPEIKAALNRGKQIEQFLGGFLYENQPAIHYLVLRPHKSLFAVTHHQVFDDGNSNFTDIVEFSDIDPDNDPEDHLFESIEEALHFATVTFKASEDRFVNQGISELEYQAYLESRQA